MNKLDYWSDAKSPLPAVQPRSHRYITFDIDQGGLNNIRMAFEYVAVIALVTRRILVIPPPCPWYLINIGPIEGGAPGGVTALEDVIDLPALQQVLPIITTRQFINQARQHLSIPDHFAAEQLYDAKVEQSQMYQQWRYWLQLNAHIVTWNPYDTIVCLPSVEHAEQSPDLTESYVDGRQLVEFTPVMNAAPVLHFPSNDVHRALGPIATMLGCVNSDMPRLSRKLLKDHVRYHPDIYTIAERLIARLGYQKYDALHIRRNDFQYKQTRLNAEEIVRHVQPILNPDLPLYIATDEVDASFSAVFKQTREVIQWQDLLVMADFQLEIPLVWVGPIEQLICAAAKQFAGTDLSTFSSYIHRIRGYIGGPGTRSYYHSVDYRNNDLLQQTQIHRGRNYLQENPLFWEDC